MIQCSRARSPLKVKLALICWITDKSDSVYILLKWMFHETKICILKIVFHAMCIKETCSISTSGSISATLWGESIHYLNASTLKLLRSCFTKCRQGQRLSIFSNPLKPSCYPTIHIILLLLLFLIKAQKSAENTAPISSVHLKYSEPFFNGCYKSTHWSPRHLIYRRKTKLCL